MKRLGLCFLTLLLTGTISFARWQQPTGGDAASPAATKARRGPVFRANKEQITQAQALLKRAGHYAGEATGKLDPDTRAALKKYQTASGLKETGTLNRATLEKMGIALTEKQKAI